MLEITLFGSFDLKRDSVSVRTTWTRQAHRLLALLTLNHDRAVSTSWVIEALMIPDSVLPQSLGELYDAFGEERKRLVHQSRQIHFDTAGITIDLYEFNQLIGRGKPDHLEEAIRLYSGGLLKDWEEEGWFAEERENCLLDYVASLDTLSGISLSQGKYDVAARYLWCYVKAYPEMDAAWSRLAEIYSIAGNTLEVEETREKYLKSLEFRSEQEGRILAPSQRFLQACESAGFQYPIPNTQQPVPVLNSPPHLTSPTQGRGIDARSVPTPNAERQTPAPIPNTQYLIPIYEPVGGAVAPDSPFYIERAADVAALESLARRDSFILVKGPRQVGKSSLLARLIAAARGVGCDVVRTDWQKLPQSALVSDRTFLLELAETFVDHLDLAASPSAYFESPRGGISCFDKFIKREALANITEHLVWVIDEADRLFEQSYRNDVYAMLRSWNGERAVDHTGRWQKLTVVIAYATEAYLFISNMDQSPFNIGTRLELDDFLPTQVEELNERCGSPLQTESDKQALYDLIGGHPYLLRRAMQMLCTEGITVDELTESAASGDSVFKDHLVRMRNAIGRDSAMEDAVRQYLQSGIPPDQDMFLRLRAAGVMRGASPHAMRPRCLLYQQYLRGNLK